MYDKLKMQHVLQVYTPRYGFVISALYLPKEAKIPSRSFVFQDAYLHIWPAAAQV